MPVIYDVIFHRLLGFLSFDVDVSRLDINQCDSSSTVTPSLEDHSGVFFKIFIHLQKKVNREFQFLFLF